MPGSRLEYLFNNYVSEKCSLEEEKELMALLAGFGNEQEMKKLLEKFIQNTGSDIEMPKQVADSILKNIFQRDKAKVILLKKRRSNFRLGFVWLLP